VYCVLVGRTQQMDRRHRQLRLYSSLGGGCCVVKGKGWREWMVVVRTGKDMWLCGGDAVRVRWADINVSRSRTCSFVDAYVKELVRDLHVLRRYTLCYRILSLPFVLHPFPTIETGSYAVGKEAKLGVYYVGNPLGTYPSSYRIMSLDSRTPCCSS
jgi:hypothetical protein